MHVSVSVFDPHASLPAGAAAAAADGVVASIRAGMTVGEITDDIQLRVGSCLADANVTLTDGRVSISLVGASPEEGATSSLAILPVRGGEARTVVYGWDADTRVARRWILEAAVDAANAALCSGGDEAAAARAAVGASFGEFLSANVALGEGADFDMTLRAAD